MTRTTALMAAWLAQGLLAACLAAPGQAATLPSALDRPALTVRSPERAVLLAATLAGPRVVAVGERGLIVLSDDLGKTWRQAGAVPTSVTLTAVQFVDATHGWAIGHAGVILASHDGGNTWSRQADGRTLGQPAGENSLDKPLLALHFEDARRGFVVGAYNLFFETDDGGATWKSAMQRLPNPKALHLYAIRTQRASILIAGEQGLLLRSRDGGRSFERLSSPYNGSWFSLAGDVEGGLLIAGLRGHAYHTHDGGDNWARLEGAAQASFVASVRLADGSALLVNQAGQLLTTRLAPAEGRTLSALATPPLALPADVLPLPDGSLLAVGLAGAMRLPVPGLPAVSPNRQTP